MLAGSSYSKISGMYPPEFIELSLAENDGILSGHYRSRYRIADQAISPVVSFQFEGRAGADRASLSWSGSGGSKGQVQLRLLPGGGLEVSWIADQVSPELQLISGTATLARKWE